MAPKEKHAAGKAPVPATAPARVVTPAAAAKTPLPARVRPPEDLPVLESSIPALFEREAVPEPAIAATSGPRVAPIEPTPVLRPMATPTPSPSLLQRMVSGVRSFFRSLFG